MIIPIGSNRRRIEIENRMMIRTVAIVQPIDTSSPMPKLLRILAGWSSA
jgi:hypothetical protein